MSRPPAPLATLAALAAGALLLTGCGSGGSSSSDATSTSSGSPGADFSSLSAQEIQDAAKAATTGATSLHLSGSLTKNGQQESLDLQLDDQGSCKGTLGIAGNGTAEILGAGGQYWFRPDTAFWKAYAGAQADQIIATVGTKYVTNPDLSSVCDLNGFFNSSNSTGSKPPQNLGTDTVDGQPVIKIGTTDSSGSTVGDVLVSDPHYVVKLERTGPDAGSFTLSDFGAALDVQAPSADQQISIDQLGGH